MLTVGKYFSPETRRRMSEAAKQRCASPGWQEWRQSLWQPFCSGDDLERAYVVMGWNQQEIADEYGVTLKRVQTAMRKFGIKPRRRIKRDQRGDRNSTWKGDRAGYQALHLRVIVQRGQPQCCEDCGTTDPAKHYDWANLTGNYADVSDYKRLCRSCHWKLDGIEKNLGRYAGRREVPNA